MNQARWQAFVDLVVEEFLLERNQDFYAVMVQDQSPPGTLRARLRDEPEGGASFVFRVTEEQWETANLRTLARYFVAAYREAEAAKRTGNG